MKIKSVLFVAAVCVLASLTSCGGSKKGGLPDYSDDEFAVATIGTSSAALQTTYPATIKGIQDVEVRPKVSGFLTKVFVHEGQTVSAGQASFSIYRETHQAAVAYSASGPNTGTAPESPANPTSRTRTLSIGRYLAPEPLGRTSTSWIPLMGAG